MNGNKPCQTDKIRSSVVDTRQLDSAPGAQTHNPSILNLAPSGDLKIVQCVVKNQNKTCNVTVTLVTYPGVLEFDPWMRLSCDGVSMTLKLCCLLVRC